MSDQSLAYEWISGPSKSDKNLVIDLVLYMRRRRPITVVDLQIIAGNNIPSPQIEIMFDDGFSVSRKCQSVFIDNILGHNTTLLITTECMAMISGDNIYTYEIHFDGMKSTIHRALLSFFAYGRLNSSMTIDDKVRYLAVLLGAQ